MCVLDNFFGVYMLSCGKASEIPASKRQPSPKAAARLAQAPMEEPMEEAMAAPLEAAMEAAMEDTQTLEGSFSAVSNQNFASKYALESSRRDLHNALLCTALQSQFFC